MKAMAAFYLAIDGNKLSQADKVSASLAKESASDIIKLIDKYKSKHSVAIKKQLHASLRTLGRGVEGFDDQLINEQHRRYGPLRYEFLEFLERSVH